MGAREKIAFLSGLLEGLSPSGEAEKKIYAGIIQALEALAEEIDDHDEILKEHEEFIEDLSDYCEQLEDDMDRLETSVGDLGEYSEDDMEDGYESMECPECGHMFFFSADDLEDDGTIQCPECGFMIQV